MGNETLEGGDGPVEGGKGPSRPPGSLAGTQPSYSSRNRWGLLGGGGLFLLLLVVPPPPGLSPEGWRTAAVAILMAVWWMSEALPIPATALLPLVLFPVLGILDMGGAATPYANELIFLFMGGFFLAFAMERWNLHRRIALTILGWVGEGPRALVLGFMVASGFLSMWISNTATAAMMLPIAMAVGELFRPPHQEKDTGYSFGIALMLGIAYGASIGGVATLIGTPPNAIMAGAAQELLGVEVGFLKWMIVGLPVAVILIPVAWALLVFVLYPPGELKGDGTAILARERREMGAPSRGEWTVGAVFLLTALAWVFREPKDLGAFAIPGLQSLAPAIRDSTIAMGAALLLFLIPVNWRRGIFALDWATARRIPWGVLVLFGGGLSLARAMEQSGLAAWIGAGVGAVGVVPSDLLAALVATLFIFLTEITSNTATATMAMPVMAGVAVGLGADPLTLMATAAMAASMAFMLPVATPPNAIVFASDYLSIPVMVKAGIWMNLIAIAVITAAVTLLIPHLVARV
ncbi:MAG: DASS family sodium-coupled anion symporter [Gemmatimonadota bacterium]